jgi:hypothetical protein
MPPPTRLFRVHARHLDAHHARTLSEVSFEAAAVAYLEHLHPVPAAPLRVIVRDAATGTEHCFDLDPDSADLSPCP